VGSALCLPCTPAPSAIARTSTAGDGSDSLREFMCDLHELTWDGGNVPHRALFQMPFSQQAFNWAFIVCVIWEVMKQAGKSELAASPPSPVLSSGSDVAVKALEIPSRAVVPCLRRRVFIPQAGGKTIILHPDLSVLQWDIRGTHLAPPQGAGDAHPRVFGGEKMGAPNATPGSCSPVMWCHNCTRP